MIDEWELLDDELIREAADLQMPPRPLRSRVLAAVERECRRRMWRRVLYAACLLLPMFGLGLWSQRVMSRAVAGALQPSDRWHAGGSLPQRPAGRYVSTGTSAGASRNLTMLPALQEWELVELLCKHRWPSASGKNFLHGRSVIPSTPPSLSRRF